MNIENYIKMLLSDQETIVVPDLGAFVVSTEESLYGEVVKKVTFDSNNTQNDGLLAGMIARYESITEEEAMLKIENFVAIILREVSQNKLCTIEGFGKFYYDWKDSLGFDLEPEIQETLQGAVAKVEAVEESVAAEAEGALTDVEKSKKGSSMKMILAISVPVLIIGGIVALVLTKKVDPSKITHMMDKEEAVDEEMASDSTATEETATEETASSETTESTETTSETASSTASTTTTKPAAKATTSSAASSMSSSVAVGDAETVQKGRYYVIAGGFSSQENAQKMANKVGGGAKVLAPTGNNLYRVSLYDTDNLDEANKKVTELNSGYNNTLWVLK